MTAPTPEPFVLRQADAVRISAEDAPVVLRLATSNDTGGAFTLLEVGDADIGSGPPMHIHREADETFYVLSGSYRMHIAGEDHHAPAGTLIFIPKGTVHGFVTLEPGTRKLNLYVPSAFDGFFEELDNILPDGTEEQLIALNERYATEIVGPIPPSYR
jgi:quercetin dioxygenase-like cupin family protein